MLLEYDDDELGDLEDVAEEIHGETDLRDFAPEIEIFVDEVKEKGFRALVRDSETNVLVGKDDDVIRITKNLENAVLKGETLNATFTNCMEDRMQSFTIVSRDTYGQVFPFQLDSFLHTYLICVLF